MHRFHFGSAVLPQPRHFRNDSFDIQLLISGLSCVPKSVTWNASSRIMYPPWGFSVVICDESRQYHLNLSIDSPGLTRSMTTPIVSANLTGLCGTLGGNKNIEPSSMIISLNSPLSTTFKHMEPFQWDESA